MPSAYFSLQLIVAAHYAAAAGVPFEVAVVRCTNLRRRLHLWGPSGAEQWASYLAELGQVRHDPEALLSTTLRFHEVRPPLAPAPTFGCFSYDSPNAAGVLRIHFMPPEGLDASPLAAAAVDARRHELRAMFQHIRSAHPEARSVMGVSWLYNLQAYTRLFPQAFVKSIQPVSGPLHLNGSSTWGQVLDWRQQVKPAARDELLRRLVDMDITAPWRVFPLQAQVATCGVQLFHDAFT
ncbi:hypothetical protein DFR41_11615 [Pseudacidovorax intermedius]|uniref:Uncharacterized protein n=1 Tax=Pseudacidovorax intermedius TaxID=433924 RepID=A0A370F687_9BURK|nr:hypothetical protein [Pseudacidovorax intermedius]RDI17688.1 hypothetical protein DFR41_11615 [Pseudacidovorax intermedius]